MSDDRPTPRFEMMPPTDDAARLAAATHDEPFAVLGPHERDGRLTVTAMLPGARSVTAVTGHDRVALSEHPSIEGLFAGEVASRAYRFEATGQDGATWQADDPYRYGPVLGEMDEHLLGEGRLQRLWWALGAHVMTHEGTLGVHFAVWAPNAQRVSVVGSFNQWDGRRHAMRRRGGSGVWEIFIPDLGDGTVYKYEILSVNGDVLPLKADPVGFGSQHPPENASIVRDITGYGWDDSAWMASRQGRNSTSAPISIYEVHLGSWMRIAAEDNRMMSYAEAAVQLVDYVADMGFTHIELMPISEFPFDGSWGYQPVGLYAPTIRHGTPHEFRDLVEAAHRNGLGVLVDWVPAHFPTDPHGLGQFDGTAVYEHADPREGFHHDWNTLIYNYGRPPVVNFLVANARYWLEEYHLDGLRVDAVASMLYRDYSRKDGEWIPNKHGGRENLEAIAMMQSMNLEAHAAAPGAITVAEESTSFPGVSRPVDQDGLGFSFKWNMGWMNDTLTYIQQDPLYRKYHHAKMTFGIHYAFSENFVLPISHDEVVHGKGSMIGKMPGQGAERFANLRAYYAFMWGHPGKKLLFMGQEFAQPEEWNFQTGLNWAVAETPGHDGVRRLVRDLNTLYRGVPALHAQDCKAEGFTWIDSDDADASVLSWLRWSSGPDDPPVAVIVNFTPVDRGGYRVGLPRKGRWREAINTDADIYGGAGGGNMGAVTADGPGHKGQPTSATIALPPLSAVILVHDP